MATLHHLKPDTAYDWRVTAGDTTAQGTTFRTVALHPVPDPELKTFLALVVAYREAHERGDGKKSRAAYIALGKFAKGVAAKYGLPFE